jgi:hypothetical protein
MNTTERMPARLMAALFKRLGYLEQKIAERQAQGAPVNYYLDELRACLWLLDQVGITYEQRTQPVPDPEPFSVEPRIAALPMDKQQEIVGLYRRGHQVEAIAEAFGFPRRAILNVLNQAGYAVSLTMEKHRDQGLSR